MVLDRKTPVISFVKGIVHLKMKIECHVDYFDDVLTNFVGLELCGPWGTSLAVYGGSESSQISSKISYVLKRNEGLTGLE